MNFDAIEGLAEEEVQQLFEQDVLDESDSVRMGYCKCQKPSSPINFGSKSYGTCALQLTYQASCQECCRRHKYSYTNFYTSCFCSGTSSESNWSDCRN